MKKTRGQRQPLRKLSKRTKQSESGYTTANLPRSAGSDYVVMELRHDSQIAVSPTGFAGPAVVESATTALNKTIGAFSLRQVAPHFDLGNTQLHRRSTAAPTSLKTDVSAEFAHAGFVRIVPRRGQDCDDLVSKLNRNKSVWKAVVAPRPVPAVAASGKSKTSRNFEPSQGYLHDAPNGIGAMQAWKQYQAKGKGVTICDIEGNWQFDHEDLPRVRNLGGQLIQDLGWRNHGTAVLGEMVSRPNGHGVVGISHQSKAAVHSAMVNGVFSAETAIANATKKLRAGDVILIELHAPSPLTKKYIAMQYWDAVFSAIRAATAKGITVVEAAGNGNENFDQRIYRNTGLQKDSGAIIVGAGVPPTNYFGYNGRDWGYDRYQTLGKPRSRIFFSNYGKIVDVQAWGWHVTTTGYGDAQGGDQEKR
jgi:subtilisin family serine protease